MRRVETHREKMERKAQRRAKIYASADSWFARQLRGGKRVRPNNGNSRSIWPDGKTAKPGRMA